MNPFDEISVEEELRLTEAGKAEEVVLVYVGLANAEETLRTALAVGAPVVPDRDGRRRQMDVTRKCAAVPG